CGLFVGGPFFLLSLLFASLKHLIQCLIGFFLRLTFYPAFNGTLGGFLCFFAQFLQKLPVCRSHSSHGHGCDQCDCFITHDIFIYMVVYTNEGGHKTAITQYTKLGIFYGAGRKSCFARRPARPEKPLTKATTRAEATSISTTPVVPVANAAPPVKIP